MELVEDERNEMGREELLKCYRNFFSQLYKIAQLQGGLEETGKEIAIANEQKTKIIEQSLFVLYFLIVGAFLIIIGIMGRLGEHSAVIGIVLGIGFPVVSMFIDDKIFKPRREIIGKRYYSNVIAPLEKDAFSIKEALDELWDSKEMKEYDVMIPEKYKDMEILNQFIIILNDGRADSQKEVFNIYEEEQHRREMINLQHMQLQNQVSMIEMQQQQNQLSEQQLSELNDIKKGQRKLSKQVRYGNVVSTLDFLFKK